MAHHLATSGYARLAERVDRLPPGIVPSELLRRIFSLLFDEADAGLLAQLPLRPFTTRQAARAWKVKEGEAARLLDGLAERALLLDGEHEGRRLYVFPPPMAGFLEFSMMRVRADLDQHALAEMLYQYVNVEDDFITLLFAGPTQLGRALVHQPSLPGGWPGGARESRGGHDGGDHGHDGGDHGRAGGEPGSSRGDRPDELLAPRIGDAFAWLCAALSVLLLGVAAFARKPD